MLMAWKQALLFRNKLTERKKTQGWLFPQNPHNQSFIEMDRAIRGKGWSNENPFAEMSPDHGTLVAEHFEHNQFKSSMVLK
jgi:hypothetical protein